MLSAVDPEGFADWFSGLVAHMPGVEAVALGGSRAQGTASASSDWDFALYYREHFEVDHVRRLGFDGVVSDLGGWGGGVMNGGAWLTVEGHRVDLHYRDLNAVEYWWSEARAGRFKKELLLFYAAGIPTYSVIAELAINRVLIGELPHPTYPDSLAESAEARWTQDALLSIRYARKALDDRGDATVAVANGSRALIELAHARAAGERRWVVNEKGLVAASRLSDLGGSLAYAASDVALAAALTAIEEVGKQASSDARGL